MRIDIRNSHPIGPFQEFMAAAMRLSSRYGDTFRNGEAVTEAVGLAWEYYQSGDRSLLRWAWRVLSCAEILHVWKTCGVILDA